MADILARGNASKALKVANDNKEYADSRIDNLLNNTEQPSEIVDARLDKDGNASSTLKDRLDSEQTKHEETRSVLDAIKTNTSGQTFADPVSRINDDYNKVTAQLADKADQVYVDLVLASVTNGGPKELFYSANALETAYPNGADYTVLVFDSSYMDGAHSFIWTGTEWKDIGLYQGLGIANDSVKEESIAEGGAIQFINGFKSLNSELIIQPNNVKNNVKTNGHSDLSLVTNNYGSFYNHNLEGSLQTFRTNNSFIPIPEKMTKYMDQDLALKIIHNYNENTDTSNKNFTYSFINKRIDYCKDDDITVLIEFMFDIDTPVLQFQAYTAANEHDYDSQSFKAIKKYDVSFKGGVVYSCIINIPGTPGQYPNWLKWCVFRKGEILTPFNLTISRFLVVKGKRRLAELPITRKEKELIIKNNISTVELNDVPEIKKEINNHKYIFENALTQTNYTHEDSNWDGEYGRHKWIKNIDNVEPTSTFKTITGRVTEINYFDDNITQGGFGYFFRYSKLPVGAKKVYLFFRGMLKDYAQPSKVVRLYLRLFKSGSVETHPDLDISIDVTLQNNTPYTNVFEYDLPENHEFVEMRFGIWNLRETNTEILVIQHEAMGAYFDCNKYDIITMPLTMTDLEKLSLPQINKLKEYIDSSPDKTIINDVIVPNYIYTVSNDITSVKKARQYSTAIYIDHMLKTVDETTRFKDFCGGEGDKFYFVSPIKLDGMNIQTNNYENIHTSQKTLKIESDVYSYPDKTVTLRSTKASLSKSKFPKVLFIGDSITQNVGANSSYGNGEYAFWAYVRKLFEMDRIDGGNNPNEYNFISLGSNNSQTISIDYNGVQKTVPTSASGIAGWTLANFLHHSSGLRPSQETWDLLGLGDGSGTDYVGNTEQKMQIALANETNSTATPDNHFFDNDKTGPLKFSISKWLERYRTLDDNGNRLTMGDPTIGTLVDTWKLSNTDVCTPTHVVIQHGRNDYSQYSGVDPLLENYRLLIDDLQASIPGVVIIICLTPDTGGTFFRDRYPQIIGDVGLINANRTEWLGAKRLIEEFGNMEDQNVFISPNYFVQPTAFGYALQDISMPESLLGVPGFTQYESKRYRVVADYPDSHQGSPSHLAWAYQIYSLLKYQLSK